MAFPDKNSVVDALKNKGLPSDFASRAKLAATKGIKGYTGSATQNDRLRNLVSQGAGSSLKASSPKTAPPKASAPSTKVPAPSTKTSVSAKPPSATRDAAPQTPKVAAAPKPALTVKASAPSKAGPLGAPSVKSSGNFRAPSTANTTKAAAPSSSPSVGTKASDTTDFYRQPASPSDGLLVKAGLLQRPLVPTDKYKAGSAYQSSGKMLDTAAALGAGAAAGKLAGLAAKGIGSVATNVAGKMASGAAKKAVSSASPVKLNLARSTSVPAPVKGTTPASVTMSSKPGAAPATKVSPVPAPGRAGGTARTTQRNAILRQGQDRAALAKVSKPGSVSLRSSTAPTVKPNLSRVTTVSQPTRTTAGKVTMSTKAGTPPKAVVAKKAAGSTLPGGNVAGAKAMGANIPKGMTAPKKISASVVSNSTAKVYGPSKRTTLPQQFQNKASLGNVTTTRGTTGTYTTSAGKSAPTITKPPVKAVVAKPKPKAPPAKKAPAAKKTK